jgi:hypothetical protein
MKKTVFIILASFYCFASCIDVENPSDIPLISFNKSTANYCQDELGNLNKCVSIYFTLKDGDGNVGLSESDTLAPFTGIFSHNFYYNVFIPSSNGFISWEDLSINYFNIPYIVPDGQNKILIADIEINLSFPVFSLTSDTLLINFYVYDRALNQSNTAFTDTIFFE